MLLSNDRAVVGLDFCRSGDLQISIDESSTGHCSLGKQP